MTELTSFIRSCLSIGRPLVVQLKSARTMTRRSSGPTQICLCRSCMSWAPPGRVEFSNDDASALAEPFFSRLRSLSQFAFAGSGAAADSVRPGHIYGGNALRGETPRHKLLVKGQFFPHLIALCDDVLQPRRCVGRWVRGAFSLN